MKSVLVGVLVLLVGRFAAVASENWPQFRGPQARGVSAVAAPTSWDVAAGRTVAWKAPIPGLAHASPIVWGDRVFVATAVGETEGELRIGLYGDIEPVVEDEVYKWRLLALDKESGDVIWDQLALEARPRVARHTKATHCNSTPATDGRHIVSLFGSEGLFCFSWDGELLWRKDLGPMDSGFFRVKSAQWGFGSSPVIHEGKVIVQCDVQEGSFLAAFRVEDGEELWRTAREDVPTWSTPTIHSSESGSQALVNGWRHSGGYDLETGAEIWRLDGGGDIPVPTPILGHGMVYLTSAHGSFRPIRAIRLTATGDITPESIEEANDAIAWVHPRKGSYLKTPVLVGDYIFSLDTIGIARCFDALNGEVLYEERLDRDAGGFTASPVCAGDHLYFASETGTVYVVPAKPEFEILATNELGETCLSTPAISDGTLYFRTRHHVMAIGEKELD